MREEFNLLIKSCVTRTNPATETKSIGLQAGARVVIDCPDLWAGVFAMSPKQPYRDMTNPARLSGPRHLDNFIMTPNTSPLIGPDSYRDFAKTHTNPDTPRYRSGQAHGN